MKMLQECGVINDIKPENFIADGSLYLNQIINDEENISLISAAMTTLTFDYKVRQITEATMNANEFKTEEYKNSEVVTFFEKYKDKIIDVIFFPDSGIKGIDKVVLEENSIFYISITGNIKIGFLISKTIARYIFGDDQING